MIHQLLRTAARGVPAAPTTVVATPRVELELVSKAHESSYLRAPMTKERACSQGDTCEGVLMAKENPFERDEDGFVCVEFRTPRQEQRPHEPTETGMCLLCLRKQTALTYYNAVANNCHTNEVTQPHRVKVDTIGEYSSDVCIRTRPNEFNGVVSPFVKHERHHYTYRDGRIDQTGNVNFREAPPLIEPG